MVFEAGEHVSYANCGLPYFVSDVIAAREALLLQTPESLWRRFRIDVRVNTRVTSIDREARTVIAYNAITGTTETEAYDYLVLATGAKAGSAASKALLWLAEAVRDLPNVLLIEQDEDGFATIEDAADAVRACAAAARSFSHASFLFMLISRPRCPRACSSAAGALARRAGTGACANWFQP